MDPDGGYESFHSTRSVGGVLPKDAKLDDVDESNKKLFENDEDDEEMGLKPSPKPSTPKVLLTEEKEGSIDLKPSAPPAADDLGCLPSAPPLEPSLHPLPEDDATATPTLDSSHPPEPPGFKEDPTEGSNTIPGSVALPIGLDNADCVLPVASVVPIITDATGTDGEGTTPSTQPVVPSSTNNCDDTASTSTQVPSTGQPMRPSRSTAARASARRVPSFFRQSSTHPDHAAATLADTQPPREERGKRDSQEYKCTPCKKLVSFAAIVILAIVATAVCVILVPAPHPSWPDCMLRRSERHYIGNGSCDGGKYNTEECGWDGGDCVVPNLPYCHYDNPSGIGNGKCNEMSIANTPECRWDGWDCGKNPDKFYPNCRVSVPGYLNDGYCDDGEYNKRNCGWDGGDCLFGRNQNKRCTGSITRVYTNKSRKWCQTICVDEGNRCKAYDISIGDWDYQSPGTCRIFGSYQGRSSANNWMCYKKV